MMIRCSPSPEQMVMSASFRSANFDLMIINKNSSNAYHHDIVAEVIFLLCFFASLVLYRFRSFATSLFHYLSHSNVCIWTGFLNSISSVFLMFYFFMDFFFTSSSNFWNCLSWSFLREISRVNRSLTFFKYGYPITFSLRLGTEKLILQKFICLMYLGLWSNFKVSSGFLKVFSGDSLWSTTASLFFIVRFLIFFLM